jgi:hypothetical protein
MHHKLLIAVAVTALLTAPALVSAQKAEPPGAGSKSEQRVQPGGPGGPGSPGGLQNEPRGRAPSLGQDQPGTQTQRDDDQQQTPRRGTAQDQDQQQTPRRGTAQDQDQQQPRRGTAQDQASPSAGAKVQLSQEQRTRIHSTIIKSRPNRVTNVNFNISVGTKVPRTVRLVALPPTIIEIVPEYRGYLYFVYEDEIVIVEPSTMEIVAVIEV